MKRGVGPWVVLIAGALVTAVAASGTQTGRDHAPKPRSDVPI